MLLIRIEKGNAMSSLIRIVILSLLLVGSGCATHDARHEQCGRYTFTSCLDVTAQQCDELFDRAEAACEKKLGESTMYDNMPDSMREGHLNRCMASAVVVESGRPEAETKGCLRW